MKSGGVLSQDTEPWISSLRSFCVLAVIILHALLPFSNLSPWWFVLVDNKSVAVNLAVAMADFSLMNALFFLSGYLAAKTLSRRGPKEFLIKRLKELLPNFLVFSLVIYPLFLALFSFWKGDHGGTAVLQALLEPRLFSAIQPPYGMPCLQLWFLGVLIAFHSGLAASARKLELIKRGSGGFWAFACILCGPLLGCSVALVFKATGFEDPERWGATLSIFCFQPTHLPLYLFFYCLGVVVWARKVPIQLLAAPILAAGLSCLCLGIKQNAFEVPSDSYIGYGLGRAGYSLCLTTILILAFFKTGNALSAAFHWINPFSLRMYIIHLSVVVVLQSLLLHSQAASAYTFGLVLVICSLGLSYLLARWSTLWKMLEAFNR